MRAVLAAPLVLLALAGTVQSQSVSGHVVDADTNNRIAAADIMVVQVDTSSRTFADSLGAFRVRVIPGMWTLRVTALGYQDLITAPMDIKEKEHLTVVVVMSSKPLEIAPITVIARSNRALTRLEEFYNRKRRNHFGYFLDEKTIARMPSHDVSDLLRRVPGAWVERNRVSMRGCADTNYLVDGMPVYPMSGETPTEAINAMVSPSEIAGIEVYRGEATIPMELQVHLRTMGDNLCGLVAIWLKR